MPFPSVVIELIGKITRFRNLSVIDGVTLDREKASDVVGRFHDLSMRSVEVDCDYKIDNTVHSLKAAYRDGPNNNTLKIDDVDCEVVDMILKPDFDVSGIPPRVTLEAELQITYRMSGTEHNIRLSSMKIGA